MDQPVQYMAELVLHDYTGFPADIPLRLPHRTVKKETATLTIFRVAAIPVPGKYVAVVY